MRCYGGGVVFIYHYSIYRCTIGSTLSYYILLGYVSITRGLVS